MESCHFCFKKWGGGEKKKEEIMEEEEFLIIISNFQQLCMTFRFSQLYHNYGLLRYNAM
jgi:hypothetical protein